MSDNEDPKLTQMDKVMAISKADTIKDKIDDLLERIENVDTDEDFEEAMKTTQNILDKFQDTYEEEWGINNHKKLDKFEEDDEE